MAKRRCKHRSTFMLTRKCMHCKHRRECMKKVKRNRRRSTVMVGIALVFLCVCAVYTIANIMSKPEEKIQPLEVVSYETQKLKSYQKEETEITEVKTITREQVEIEKNAPAVVEVAEETVEAFSESEKIAMGKTIYKEARGECEEGRIAIGAVILNRLATGSAEYGAENGDIMEVITYPAAFAYPKDMTDEFFLNCPEYEMCMAAVEAAINGEDPTRAHFSEGALHFYSLVEPLSEAAKTSREGVDTYVIGNQAFHNDMND